VGLGTAALVTGVGLFASSRPAHTAGGQVPVTVANTVPTTDLDSPDQKPFQITLSPSSSTSNVGEDTYTVPAGKRVVIDYYSAELTEYPLGGYGYVYLITTVNGQTAYYKVIPPQSSAVPMNQLTKIYADPGTTITADSIESSETSSGGNIILSGHTVTVR
jgi:hypothetical protein